MNFVLLFVQFFLTDKFLNNKFRLYGLRVMEYYSWSQEERNDKNLGLKWAKPPFSTNILHIHLRFVVVQESNVHRVSNCDLLQYSQCWSLRSRPDSQRILRPNSKHYKRENLLDSVVLVRLPRPRLRLIPLLQTHHPHVQWSQI